MLRAFSVGFAGQVWYYSCMTNALNADTTAMIAAFVALIADKTSTDSDYDDFVNDATDVAASQDPINTAMLNTLQLLALERY